MSEVIYYIEVEGVGYASGGSALTYRWCTRRPTGAAAAARYIEGMDLPSAMGADVDLLKGDVTYSGLSLSLAAGTQALLEFGRSYTAAVSHTTTALDQQEADSVDVPDSSVFAEGQLVWIERECAQIDSIPDGDSIDLDARGVLGTRITQHPINVGVYESNPILRGREVYLYRTDDSETTPTLLWAGILDDVRQDDAASLQIECVSGGAWLRGVIMSQPWTGTVQPGLGLTYATDREGAQSQPVASIIIERDTGSGSRGDVWCAVQLEDTVYAGERGSTDGAVRVRVNRDPLLGDRLELESVNAPRIVEVLTTLDPAVNPFRRYEVGVGYEETRNPFYIALILMLSDGSSSASAPAGINYSGSYSYSTLPAGVGLSVPVALVDVTAMEAAAAECDAVADRVVITSEDTGVDVVKRLLWPLGYMMVPSAAGVLTPIRLSDTVSTDTATAVTSGDMSADIEVAWSRQLGSIYGSGSIEWDDGGDADLVLSDVSLRLYRNLTDVEYSVDASYYTRDRNRPAVQAAVIVAATQLVYPPPLMSMTVGPTIAETISVGSLLSVTHPSIPTAAGSYGLTDAGCYVISETLDLAAAGAKDLTVWYTGHDLTRVGVIHWSVRVLGYAPATRVVTVANDYWTDTDTSYPQVGDRLRLHECDGTARSNPAVQQVEVSAIASGSITLSAGFMSASGGVDPQAGDLLRGVSYIYIDNDEDDTYIYMAGDNDEQVGTSDPYQVTR